MSRGNSIQILHVDDDANLLELSKKILSLEGYFEVDTATSVDEALKKMQITCYDAVISDFELPGKSGLELLTELLLQKNEVPFILFTGRGREEVAIKALNLGADGYINKQGNPETVYCELSHILKSSVARSKAEGKIRESEDKYQTSFNSSLDSIALIGKDGFFDCNAATLKLFKCDSIASFIQKHPKDWVPPFQPDGSPSREAANEHVKKAFETGTDHFSFVHQRSDGTTFPADVLLTLIKIKGEIVLQATIRDVTEQKQAEQQLKIDQERIALMNEKLRVVGSLTRHDIRNKLSAITAYSYLLKKKCVNHPEVIEGLGGIEAAVREAERIFELARTYERLGVEQLVYMDVEKTLSDAVDLFSDLDIEVINDCRRLELLADSFLRQLFYNFIENTRKHGKRATQIRVHFEVLQEGNVRLIYEDNGVGIPAENKKCLFKQGFSTGGSSGFGLFLIKNMLDVYGWSVKETGVDGMGAKFEITIPRLNKIQQINAIYQNSA